MTAAVPVDHLGTVFGRLQRAAVPGADDLAVRVVTRFLSRTEPAWLRARPDQQRLDVLTVCGVLGSRRA
ncbi:hypothetical protein F1C76_08130 [Geodermatophilaceae bacterium NBWT11]|nr:hypothetical protein F1C76_08130 [Geodermatophilaceae bacterium NBWT11]